MYWYETDAMARALAAEANLQPNHGRVDRAYMRSRQLHASINAEIARRFWQTNA